MRVVVLTPQLEEVSKSDLQNWQALYSVLSLLQKLANLYGIHCVLPAGFAEPENGKSYWMQVSDAEKLFSMATSSQGARLNNEYPQPPVPEVLAAMRAFSLEYGLQVEFALA